jgi:hypothetical protein
MDVPLSMVKSVARVVVQRAPDDSCLQHLVCCCLDVVQFCPPLCVQLMPIQGDPIQAVQVAAISLKDADFGAIRSSVSGKVAFPGH